MAAVGARSRTPSPECQYSRYMDPSLYLVSSHPAKCEQAAPPFKGPPAPLMLPQVTRRYACWGDVDTDSETSARGTSPSLENCAEDESVYGTPRSSLDISEVCTTSHLKDDNLVWSTTNTREPTLVSDGSLDDMEAMHSAEASDVIASTPRPSVASEIKSDDQTHPPPPPPVAGRTRRRRRHQRPDNGSEVAPVGLPADAENEKQKVPLTGSGGEAGVVDTPPTTQAFKAVERMLREFKTIKCISEATSPHDHRCCPFYHNERDRRRSVVDEAGRPRYSLKMCPDQFEDGGTCPNGDNCTYCHSTAELHYHPDTFRKRLCHQGKHCPRRRFCAFAHTHQELLSPHFQEQEEKAPSEEFVMHKFKTQWCPNPDKHDWDTCVYAHTHRDWRRTPLIGYSSRPCGQWMQNMNAKELSYEQRCPRGISCPMAHGAKEQLYHQHFYKTAPCKDEKCDRGVLCAFMHGPDDARQPTEKKLQARDQIPGVAARLEEHQPGWQNPPKFPVEEQQGRQHRRGGAGRTARAPRARATNAIVVTAVEGSAGT